MPPDMSLHDLSPEDGEAWAGAEPDFTVVKAFFTSAGTVKHTILVKVNGRWLVAGSEAYWCNTDEDLREQFESYEVVARPMDDLRAAEAEYEMWKSTAEANLAEVRRLQALIERTLMLEQAEKEAREGTWGDASDLRKGDA